MSNPTAVKDTQSADDGLTRRVVEDVSSAPDLKTDVKKIPEVNVGDEDRAVDESVNDLGWSEDPNIPIPILYGIKNEDVWQLVRRFNNQVYHIKLCSQEEMPSGIDLNIADKDEFTPEKLRSTLERVYITVGLGLASFVKHVARLRSWTERRRSAAFFITFLAAWVFDLFMPVLFALITIVLAAPRARHTLFPPAPLAAISAKTGKAKTPKAGHLGSHSLTGAAESYKGEAAEQEASNVVGSVAHLAVSTAIGNDTAKVDNYDDEKSSDEETEQEKETSKMPDPADLTGASREGQSKAKGEKPNASNQTDATADPVKQSLWQSSQPFLHALEDLADTWERFGNALEPTPPFPRHMPRMRIASIVAPLVLISMFVTSDMVYRGTTLLVILGFFGQPVIDHMKMSDLKKLLDEKIPNWQRYLELRNSILKGVPTDAQLTITLLRIGESKKSPLPPPPPAVHAPPPTAKKGKEMLSDLPDEYKEDLKQDHAKKVSEEEDDGSKKKSSGHAKSKILSLFRGGVRAGADTLLGTNRVKAEIGFEHARRKVGVVHTKPDLIAVGDGPASFHGRLHGKRGLVLISTTATTPCVSFERKWPAHAKAAHLAYTTAKNAGENKKGNDGEPDNSENTDNNRTDESDPVKALREVAEKARPIPEFSIQIDDICSLKKLNGLGWKSKLIVGWSMGGEVDDGLEILTKDGSKHVLTAMPRRDELFNRLAAMGKDHRWQAW